MTLRNMLRQLETNKKNKRKRIEKETKKPQEPFR